MAQLLTMLFYIATYFVVKWVFDFTYYESFISTLLVIIADQVYCIRDGMNLILSEVRKR